MVHLRPHTAEFDTWSATGSSGWSWDSILPYFKKSEHLQLPSISQQAQGASYLAEVHGFDGPLDIGWSPNLNSTDFAKALNSTWCSLGLEWNAEPNRGDLAGLFFYPSQYDLERGAIREDAARAYYWPVANRSNLYTFTNTTAIRIPLQTTPGRMIATGVDVSTDKGVETVSARREVILSAGAYRSPGLLEVSGIGNPRQVDCVLLTESFMLTMSE